VVLEYLLDDALTAIDDWVKEERETNATVALAASMMEKRSLIRHKIAMCVGCGKRRCGCGRESRVVCSSTLETSAVCGRWAIDASSFIC